MTDLLLLIVGILSGIGVTFTIMQGRIEDSKAETRAWVRAAIKLEEQLGVNNDRV